MQVFAPAKINFTFKVRGKLSNGFHDLESIVAFADISDEITLIPSPQFIYEVDGPFAHHVPKDIEDDLTVRAVRIFEKHTQVTVKQHMKLTKDIPAGAGLGGGSSDAASILKALNTIYETNLSEDDLCQIGESLGSDVPVCIRARPTLVEGKGCELSEVKLPYQGHLLLVWPNTYCSTQAVFQAFDANPPQENHANDLTPAAISLCPMIGECLDKIHQYEGADYVSMSGSGSTCFAVFDSLKMAQEQALDLKKSHSQWWIQTAKILS